jgi:hypothetical protein
MNQNFKSCSCASKEEHSKDSFPLIVSPLGAFWVANLIRLFTFRGRNEKENANVSATSRKP